MNPFIKPKKGEPDDNEQRMRVLAAMREDKREVEMKISELIHKFETFHGVSVTGVEMTYLRVESCQPPARTSLELHVRI